MDAAGFVPSYKYSYLSNGISAQRKTPKDCVRCSLRVEA